MDIKEIDRVVAHLVKELGQAKSHIKELEEEGKRITSFLGKPMEYWIELDVYAKENMYEEMILKICNLEAHIKEIEEIKLEEVEQERERLSKLLIEARVEIVGLRIGIKEVLEWRNFDGDGISDPLREELYKLVESK